MTSYRKAIYDSYVEVHFSGIHDLRHLEKEIDVHGRYFKKNYLRYLPQDRGVQILDIGSGMGHFLHFLKTNGYKNACGIDLSHQQVEISRKYDLNADVADTFTYLKERGEIFDVIIMNDILEHFTKEEGYHLLGLVWAALRPRGKVMIKVPNASNPITGGAFTFIDYTHEQNFTELSLKQLLSSLKFRNVLIKGTDIYVFYKNPLNYLAIIANYLFNKLFYYLNFLYGRKSIKIFEKDLLAIAEK